MSGLHDWLPCRYGPWIGVDAPPSPPPFAPITATQLIITCLGLLRCHLLAFVLEFPLCFSIPSNVREVSRQVAACGARRAVVTAQTKLPAPLAFLPQLSPPVHFVSHPFSLSSPPSLRRSSLLRQKAPAPGFCQYSRLSRASSIAQPVAPPISFPSGLLAYLVLPTLIERDLADRTTHLPLHLLPKTAIK